MAGVQFLWCWVFRFVSFYFSVFKILKIRNWKRKLALVGYWPSVHSFYFFPPWPIFLKMKHKKDTVETLLHHLGLSLTACSRKPTEIMWVYISHIKDLQRPYKAAARCHLEPGSVPWTHGFHPWGHFMVQDGRWDSSTYIHTVGPQPLVFPRDSCADVTLATLNHMTTWTGN